MLTERVGLTFAGGLTDDASRGLTCEQARVG